MLNRSLHRDLGYLSIGFTIIFSISGILLNHHHDWNSNYSITQKEITLEQEGLNDKELIALAKDKFDIKTKMKGQFWTSPNELKLFFPNDLTIIYKKKSNQLVYEKITARFLLRAFNGLHVNEAKGYWIVFSDIYAVILFYLAISALFMVKGKYGIKGRGGILTLIGVMIPAYFIFRFF